MSHHFTEESATIKVVHVMADYMSGGIVPTYNRDLIAALSKLGVSSCMVATQAAGKSPIPVELLRATNPLSCLSVAEVIKKLTPNVIHFHDHVLPSSLWVYLLIRKLRGMPLVYTLYGNPFESKGRKIRRIYSKRGPLTELFVKYPVFAYFRYMLEQASCIVVQVEYEKKHLVSCFGIDPAKVKIIPLGVDVRVPSKREYSKRGRILYVGVLSKHKGLEDLIDAFEIIHRKMSNVRLTIVGNPHIYPYERKWWIALINKITHSPCRAHIDFLGYRPRGEVIRLCYDHDVIVLPYREITDSYTVNQACALGMPIVATRVGGLQDQIKNYVTGLLVESNSAKSLAEAMLSLLSDEELRRRLGTAARKSAENLFSLDKVAQEYYSLYCSLDRNCMSLGAN